MKKVNAIVMDYNEFEQLVCRVSDGYAGIGFEPDEWFYVSSDEYDIDDINNDLSKELGVTVVSVKIDMSNNNKDDVVIIYE